MQYKIIKGSVPELLKLLRIEPFYICFAFKDYLKVLKPQEARRFLPCQPACR